MPVWVASLMGGFVFLVGSMVGRVLIALGMSFVTFGGISVLFSGLKSIVVSNLGYMPQKILLLLGYVKIDVAITMIFSAMVARLVLMGLSNAGLWMTMRMRGPGM